MCMMMKFVLCYRDAKICGFANSRHSITLQKMVKKMGYCTGQFYAC